jgi:hypothetical protein
LPKARVSTGLKCWIAPRDIAAGEDWTKAIRNSIEASQRDGFRVLGKCQRCAPHRKRNCERFLHQTYDRSFSNDEGASASHRNFGCTPKLFDQDDVESGCFGKAPELHGDATNAAFSQPLDDRLEIFSKCTKSSDRFLATIGPGGNPNFGGSDINAARIGSGFV